MQLVIHIGTYKTGTSTIQSFLRSNQVELSKSSVWYPTPHHEGFHNQHSHVVNWIGNDNWVAINNYLDDAQKVANVNGCNTLLLSSEAFSSLTSDQIEKFRDNISFKNVKILLYFRNVYDYILSNLCQLLKSPEQNLYSGKIIGQLKRRLDYDNIVSNWAINDFDLVVLNFEKSKANLLTEFLKNAGIDGYQGNHENLKVVESINISLTLTQMLTLILTGNIENHSDHEKFIRKYNSKHEKNSVTNQEFKISIFIFNFLNIKYKHPEVLKYKNELFSIRQFESKSSDSMKPIKALIDILDEK